MTPSELAAGTYEVLRNRLREAAADLRKRLEKLNHDRNEVFGNIETTLLSTERITTQHNCIPRDLVAIGNHVLLGYNIHFGLKTEVDLSDVFAAYRLESRQFHQGKLDWIREDRFEADFCDLYRFYKDTQFSRFFQKGPFLHMVFQVGKTTKDIKSFKWQVNESTLTYIDNRSDHEVTLPQQHEFRWTRTTRDQHHYGVHPHVSIEDIVFVETVGGDLTIKVENNTDSGEGIYAEPVDDPDQTLDDAEVRYAVLGNLVLLKMKPYQEEKTRYLLFNSKLGKAMRLDEIEHACVMLPGDQGLIFPGGYYLQTGEFKRFDHGLVDMRFLRTITSSNGEDFLYLFFDPATGVYIQLRYNLIGQRVGTPLVCHGQAFFDNGEMVVFKAQEEATKHHAIQLWQTPFCSDSFAPPDQPDSLLFKIGNREIVQGMAECSELLQLIDKDDSYEGLYIDLSKQASDILDSYFWIDKPETHQLGGPLAKVQEAADAAVEEFDKVVRVRRETQRRTGEVQTAMEELIQSMDRSRFESIDDFVSALASLRQQRGQAIELKALRYVDATIAEKLEQETVDQAERLSRRCIDYLLTPGSLDSYVERVATAGGQVETVTTVTEAKAIEGELDEAASQLELLTETVSNLRIEDTTKRTEIIDSMSDVFASLNRVRAALKARVSELTSSEGQAEFASQLKLLEQTVAGYLDVADDPGKCDQYLTKVMVQIEELEGRFAEFDGFVVQLADRRDEIYAAFESRKVAMIEKRNRRAESLSAAATRILQGIDSRVSKMESTNEIAAYFAGDLMVEKVRDIVEQLRDLQDAVRVEDLQSRLKTIREDSTRQLKDRQDLFESDGAIIRLGQKRFSVNTQPLDLTTVLRSGQMCLHLTGTQYFEPLKDPALVAAKDLWSQEWISENDSVYRSEFLAVGAFDDGQPPSITGKFDEGYIKGVHDEDAQRIYQTLTQMDQSLGLLRHAPEVRAAGQYWFKCVIDQEERDRLSHWIGGFAKLALAFPHAEPAREFRGTLAKLAKESDWDEVMPIQGVSIDRAVDYLFEQLIATEPRFVISQSAANLYQHFSESIPGVDRVKWLDSVLNQEASSSRAFALARNWADAFLQKAHDSTAMDSVFTYREELAWIIHQGGPEHFRVFAGDIAVSVGEIAGTHARITQATMAVHYYEMLRRVRDYRNEVVPRFQDLHQTKSRLIQQARDEMRLEEFKPSVLTSFVRNRLIDEVYLPMIGDNLAKQMGAAGEDKRTDRMGLLLLISPPGYGKTTLMEYVANRLGIVFMKINGPTIGRAVTSLDPMEAPNAAAREEIERLNLALEMGDNVMLYLDDIQHTHPEFLQKFISLCDATRKIEGVHNGVTRTYDLRGRRVAVVMAGNPYTETGERFEVPDMLSNRADVYNLGEIIGNAAEAFEMSYLENCITSNPTLAPLSTCPPSDVRSLIQAACIDSMENLSLESNLASDQVREMFEVLRKLLKVRDVILKVNRSYIRSAAQADAYRTEPPFKLQGSYRNMNRIAEKVAAVMNEQELQSLIVGTYQQDAQTLTTDNEANVLKFKELMGILSNDEKERWDAIKYAFIESVRMVGLDSEDQAGQLMRQLGSMRDGLESIRQVISKAIAMNDGSSEERMDARLDSLRQALRATGTELAQTMQMTSKQLEEISRQQALAPPDQKVLVQHKVPRVLAELVKGQFHLMQEWMRPILDESLDNGRNLDKLAKQLESMMEDYQAVQQSIQENKKQ